MSTHDVLAYAVATEAVRRLRAGLAPWNTIFSSDVYITASRAWPVPDFVLVDDGNKLRIGAEFKPPRQTKREYLTGLGQAISYSKDFHYSLLVIPEVADDGYRISEHIVDVLKQKSMSETPVGVLSYNPSIFSPHSPAFSESHFFTSRLVAPEKLATLDQSFYAKWREMAPNEMLALLSHTYDEVRFSKGVAGNIRDRAFDKLWTDIQSGKLKHWGGGPRTYGNTPKNKIDVAKNYRNFFYHIGWTESDGALTEDGLKALHAGAIYGPESLPFSDAIATATLIGGKHLVLFNAISEYQDSLPQPFPEQQEWLDGLELYLESKGLLNRNIGRSAAAVAGVARGFLKAEKQLWKNLGLIIPYGPNKGRAFHPGRGFIFNWSRITELLQASNNLA